MTYYLNFRSSGIDGAVVEPYLLAGDGTTASPALRVVQWAELPRLFDGRNVLFCTHGFNVNYAEGARSLGRLEAELHLVESDLFVGILWPGDAWAPVVNYPFEGGDANRCGQLLADFCDKWLANAQSLSFASHSLGARIILKAVACMSRRAQALCLTAAAIDRDCLTKEFAAAGRNADRVSVLASRADWVLKIAFRVGDPISDLLRSESLTANEALGYSGPPAQPPPSVAPPWQIAKSADYGHGDYLPPSAVNAAAAGKWNAVTAFIERAFRAQHQPWP